MAACGKMAVLDKVILVLALRWALWLQNMLSIRKDFTPVFTITKAGAMYMYACRSVA